MTCIGTWRVFIWTWPSCGGAQCRGALSGRARLKTVWITCTELMMFRGRSSRPAWRSFFLRGPFPRRCSRMRCLLSTPGFRRMCSCLVTSTCHWFTTTEFTSVVSHTSLSRRTTYRSCARCCRCPGRQLGWCRQTLRAPGRCFRVILRKSCLGQLGLRDVLIGGGDQCVWRSRLL